jgi:hypothetical protein
MPKYPNPFWSSYQTAATSVIRNSPNEFVDAVLDFVSGLERR